MDCSLCRSYIEYYMSTYACCGLRPSHWHTHFSTSTSIHLSYDHCIFTILVFSSGKSVTEEKTHVQQEVCICSEFLATTWNKSHCRREHWRYTQSPRRPCLATSYVSNPSRTFSGTEALFLTIPEEWMAVNLTVDRPPLILTKRCAEVAGDPRWMCGHLTLLMLTTKRLSR